MPANQNDISHRPWPLPTGNYTMQMEWHDLLFAHWPVPVNALRELIPNRLTIDTFEGEAWIGVVPFRMSGVKLRLFPGVPGTSLFPEINVRTYVVENGKPGVFFFSLDAGSLIAVKAARAWYHLPYHHAAIESSCNADTIKYQASRKIRRNEHPANFSAEYRPVGPASCGNCGPLAHWLTERYCLYSISPRGNVYRADIHHSMWPLQLAEAEININTMTEPIGIILPQTGPLLHFSKHLEVIAWAPMRLADI